MAITPTFAWTTPYAVAYTCVEGAAGPDTANIDATPLGGTPNLFDDTIAGTPIRALVTGDLSTGLQYTNQAAARAACGIGTATAAQLEGKITVIPTTAGQTSQWSCDADVVGGTLELRLTVGAAGASSATVILRRRHSIGQ